MEQETEGQEMPEWLMYRHSWKPFLNMSARSACLIDAALFFLIKSKTSGLGTTVKCKIIRISRLAYDGLKEFLL